MAVSAVNREYILASCRNSRNSMRHPDRQEMRPKSPALGADQFRVPNQTRKERQCDLWNTRECPRPLSQYERNTAVTSGIQNSSVIPSQLETNPISSSLDPQLSRVPHHTEQVALLPLGNYRD